MGQERADYALIGSNTRF